MAAKKSAKSKKSKLPTSTKNLSIDLSTKISKEEVVSEIKVAMEKTKDKAPNKGGRPTKLTEALINIMAVVVNDALYWTDEELVDELNEKLEEAGEPTISVATFKDYKGGREQADNPLISKFSSLIKKALKKEKKLLFEELRKGEGNWTAKAWILERKFDEWNLRKKYENETPVTLEDLLARRRAEKKQAPRTN